MRPAPRRFLHSLLDSIFEYAATPARYWVNRGFDEVVEELIRDIITRAEHRAYYDGWNARQYPREGG